MDSEASPARRPRDFVPRLQFSALGICGCPLAFSRGRCWIVYFQGFTQVKQINVRQRDGSKILLTMASTVTGGVLLPTGKPGVSS